MRKPLPIAVDGGVNPIAYRDRRSGIGIGLIDCRDSTTDVNAECSICSKQKSGSS